jgi:hypothetical protein
MKSRLILLLLAAHAGAALAQYKCTAANGAITFQQTPCFGAKSEEKLNVIPNGHPPPAPPASGASGAAPAVAAATPPAVNIDKRMLANYEHQRERDKLLQAVKSAQDDKAARVQQRLADIANARRQFGDDPANAQLLRDALVSIDSRYSALGDLDESRIRQAQADLADWDSASPPPVK